MISVVALTGYGLYSLLPISSDEKLDGAWEQG